MKKSILITGFTGQVGSLFADFVLENSELEILGMMRWQESMQNVMHLTDRINRHDRIKVVYADLTDAFSLTSLIAKYKPDWISHLAAQSFPRTSFDIPIETLQTNIIGTANLLESVKSISEKVDYKPVVHVCSSSEVYGRAAPGLRLTEETKFHAASPYSLSKIATDYLGQFYAEAYGIRTFVTRMGTHSGRRRSDVFFESTVAKQIALIESGFQEPQLLLGNLESVRSYQDARDAVRAYYLLFEAAEKKRIKPGEYFNISGEETFHLREVVDILLSFSKRSDIKVKTDKNRLRPIDADYQLFDNSKLKSAIDWEPEIAVKDMLYDLLEFWRQEIMKGHVPLNR